MDEGGVPREEGWGIRPVRLEPAPEIVLTATTRQRFVVAVALPLVYLVLTLLFLPLRLVLTDTGVSAWRRAGEGLPSAVIVGLLVSGMWLLVSRGQQVRLAPTGIASVNAFRTTGVWWADVSSIDERQTWGYRRIRLTAGTGTITLAGPFSGPWLLRDRDFDEKVATINSWWHAYAPPAPRSAAPASDP